MGRDGAGRGERRSAWGGVEAEEEARKWRGGEERRRGVVAWGREESGAEGGFFLRRLLEKIRYGFGTHLLCTT